ncbi:MAG: hypothetical protein AAGC78_04470 [Cellvibrio sp.]|uniref:hypothetical protein n=1 Tax=Cellvibrio sp. TaxID=1965322 RepID=UPI0031AA6249
MHSDVVFVNKGFGIFEAFEGSATFRRNVELIIASLLFLMLVFTLCNYWPIDIWRQDSMYYVDSYADKLSEEGRWINYFLFDCLRLVPGQVAIWLSYLGVVTFGYGVAYNYTGEHRFSLIFGLLICQIPVIPVQLQWPETLVSGFLLLGFASLLARFISIYVFFPLMAVLLFGTFSVFYFVLPLLFLKDLDYKRAVLVFFLWILAFCFGYLITNLIVWQLTGNSIQVAEWRNPNYITDLASLAENLQRIYLAMSSQLLRISLVLISVLVIAVISWGIYSSIVLRSQIVMLLGAFCASGVYLSTLPLGIYIQERTLTPVFIGLISAFLLRKYSSNYMALIGLSLIFLLGLRMSVLTNNGIDWYRANTESMKEEFSQLLPYDPKTVQRLFVVAEMSESQKVFLKFNLEHGIRGRFSEGFAPPMYWLPVLKNMGFKDFRVCTNLEGWDCDYIKPFYEKRFSYELPSGIFTAWKINDHDVILTINPGFLKSPLPEKLLP